MIAAPRPEVWAAANTIDCDSGHGLCEQVAGTPVYGLGARHVHVGPPSPPHGLQEVTYVEVTAELEGHWISLRTRAGTWQQDETWYFTDAADGTTLVRASGWHLRPCLPVKYRTHLQAALDESTTAAIDRLADFVASQR